METETSHDLGPRFRMIKYHFKLNNEDLGQICGVTRQAISAIETGVTSNPRVSMITKLATNLKIDVGWLLTGEGSMLKEGSQPPDSQQGKTPSNGQKSEKRLLPFLKPDGLEDEEWTWMKRLFKPIERAFEFTSTQLEDREQFIRDQFQMIKDKDQLLKEKDLTISNLTRIVTDSVGKNEVYPQTALVSSYVLQEAS